MRKRDEIDELTGTLRGSPEPLWARLRVLLAEQAVELEKSLLVTFFPDDSSLYFGIIITQDKRAVQFDLDIPQQGEEERFSRWNDITNERTSPHAGLAEAGLFWLEREGGAIL